MVSLHWHLSRVGMHWAASEQEAFDVIVLGKRQAQGAECQSVTCN